MLLQQHASKLGKSPGRIVETAEDCFAILDGERDEFLLGLQRDDMCLGICLERGRGRESGGEKDARLAQRRCDRGTT